MTGATASAGPTAGLRAGPTAGLPVGPGAEPFLAATAATTAGWTSWALSLLDLDPLEVASRVHRLAGLPDTPEGRQVVALHLAALDLSLDLASPDLLVPQLRWESTRWHHVGADPRDPSVWDAILALLQARLDEVTLAAVVRHVGEARSAASALDRRHWAQRGCAGLSGLTAPVQTHLGHAVAGRHDEAIEHVLGLLEHGVPVEEVLLDVLAPAQHELGRLWERGVVTVAQEHMATAVTQATMCALRLRPVAGPRLDRRLVAATVPGDPHEVGLRIVTDLLQAGGWDTLYVGSGCPVSDVVDAVVTSGASLLLLGASMTAHLPALRDAVEQVRSDPRCDGVRVLAGGEPFRHVPGLGEWAGADLVASCAREALATVAGLVEEDAGV